MSHRRPLLLSLIAVLTALSLAACAAATRPYPGESAQDHTRAQSVAVAAKSAPARPAPPPAPMDAVAGASEEIYASPEPAKDSPALPPQEPISNSEDYTDYGVNHFTDPAQDRFSTFSIDVDTASYAIARRKLREGQLPPQASVRVEEFVNAFHYDYPEPTKDGLPFAVNFEAAPSPFNPQRSFLRVGVQGEHIDEETRAPIHLVFLVDTSGSMQSADKLGLVKTSLKILTENLKEGDTVAIATYAGFTSRVLEPTDATDTDKIFGSLSKLSAGGSTAMGSGLTLAYEMAYQNLRPGAVNRIIVCSDGDANVGASSHEQILSSIGDYTKEGVTLSTIGFGMGNYKDTLMEQLANKGNGNYYYIDSVEEAEEVFDEDLMGTLVVIAKDVKIQVEFNPAVVAGYRLVGYENRDVADKDFRNDAVDAGEIGAGHNVTALYELELKPDAQGQPATVRIRHKQPEGGKAQENTYTFSASELQKGWEDSSSDFRLALGAASFAEILRGSPYAEGWTLGMARRLAASADGEEARELASLIDRAISLSDQPAARR